MPTLSLATCEPQHPMLRPCLGVNAQPCGKLTPKTRCPACARTHERQRPPRPTTMARTTAERGRRAAAVQQHREQFGNWCPGWGGRAGHPSTDLTADDVIPVAATGKPSVELSVLCRSCNGRKGARAG